MTRSISKLFAAAALLAAGLSSAQVYTVQSQPMAYSALTGATSVTLIARSSFTADDEGYADIPLGFTFPYYGQNYTSVHIDSNGFLLFGSSTACNTGFVCYDGAGIPKATRTPHTVIAPWWDDEEGTPFTGPVGDIRYKTSAGQIEIEYANWYCYGGGCGFTYKVTLTASGLFQIHYGTGTGTSGSATVGFENQDGTLGAALLPCTTATSGNCSMSSWPTNTLYTIGQPVQPDIVVASVNISNLVVDGGGNITFNVSPTFQNYGQNPATPAFSWKAYLSLDKTLSTATDVLVFTSAPSVTLTGAGTAGAIATAAGAGATVTPPPPGQYYVLVEADTANVVTEALETNNVGSTLNYFVNGLDLVATSVSGPASSGPGNPIVVNAKWFNQGTSAAGMVSYRVLLSLDAIASTGDFVLFSGSRQVNGGDTVDENLNINVLGNVPGGDFYYILQIDPLNAIVEAGEGNNVSVSTSKVNMKQADLVNAATDFLDPVTGSPSRLGYFGQAARATVKVDNVGGANGVNFKVGVVISTDTTLSLLSDTIAYEQVVPQVNAGGTLTVNIPFTMPLKDRNNADFQSGNYYLFTIVDSTSAVTELNEANNNLPILGQVSLRAPAPDLAVTRLEAPSMGAVGEVIPVLRGLKNMGNVAAPAARYRYYASANQIITVDDVPLQIVSGSSLAADGTLTLAVGVADTVTELVKLPATMPPGTYYLGCIIDFGGLIPELDEQNNALASNTISIAPSSLRVSTQQLPDAVADRPFSYKLVAQGEQGPSSWSLDPSQGLLPTGMTLGTDGLISGTPTGSTVAAFTVVVSNNSRDATARLVLRVLPTTTQVEITTVSAPPVINTPAEKYDFSLGAAGGVKPYAWKVLSGTLPLNLTLTADGVLSGFPRLGLAEGSSKVTFEVQDSLGTRAQKELTIRVVAPGSIIFKNLSLSDALVGSDYGQDIAVANADGSPLARPLIFTKLGELPDGMAFIPSGEVVSIEGKALRSGSFDFSITVEDAKGRSDTAGFTIRVYPANLKLTADGLPDTLRPGDAVSFKITANTGLPPTFAIQSGQLPPGVTLDPNGSVSGTVAADKSEGKFNFVVEARDATGANGLAPFTLEVKADLKPRGCGCSNTDGLWIWALALLAPVVLKKRALKLPIRRAQGARRAAVSAVALGLVLVAVPANAQFVYQVVGPTPITYAPINGGTVIPLCLGSFTNCIYRYQGMGVSLPFPFSFYGQPVSQVTMTNHGYLVISGDDGTYSNMGIPHNNTSTFYPQTFIAPWWDDLYQPTVQTTLFRHQTFGVAPNRYMVFEWTNVSVGSTGTKFSFETILYEGTNQIRFAYGPAAPNTGTASVGIQKQNLVGSAGLACTTTSSGTCGTANFPVNMALDFFLPPDLSITTASGDQTGYAGVTYRATALVKNSGGRAATGVPVRFYLSADPVFDTGDLVIGDAAPVTIAPGAEVLVTANAPLPAAAASGTHFVIALVDAANVIVEQNEANNMGSPFVISIGPPTADLVITAVQAPANAQPGGMVQVSRTITNQGNAAAGAFKYTWYLSDNLVATVSDRRLDPLGTVTGLAAQSGDAKMEMLAIPGDVPAGQFWLGLCVNYDPDVDGGFGIPEITQVNNCATVSTGTIISSGALAVITTSLPTANQYSPYGLRLVATGGNGTYSWGIKAGGLPPGMSLTAMGDLQGSPATAGTFSFDAEVFSGGVSKVASLQLMVSSGSLPLAIVDQDLPAAEFSRSYATNLVAVGGKPPYLWKLKQDARLPVGLALATDGTLEGRANEGGEFLFFVEVTDNAAKTVFKELKIKVVSPATLHIATTGLPTGYLKQSYLQTLQAVGGKTPYEWALVKFQQLPENPTEAPGAPLGDGKMPMLFPDALGLKIEDGGNGLDYLRGTPKQAGLYALTLKATDATGAEDYTQLLLRVSYVDALAITTTALPDAFLGHPYEVKLLHNFPPEAVVTYSLPCVKQAVKPGEFACTAAEAKAQPPPGLVLTADGKIAGTPTDSGSAAASSTYSFLVKITDDQGRQDVRGLAIKVRPDYSLEKTGCSGTGLYPSGLSILLLAALALRRRRPS